LFGSTNREKKKQRGISNIDKWAYLLTEGEMGY